jgi:hypothetical protein
MRSLIALTTVLALVSACHGGHGPGQASTTLRAPYASPGDNRQKEGHPIVSELAIAVPIAPGKTEAWRQALENLVGPQYHDYDVSRRRYGLTSQTTFVQRTPMGDFALIHLTGPNVRQAFHAMSSSQDPWDVEWRKLTLNLHGIDFAKGTQVFPRVEPLYSMDAGDLAGAKPFMFIAPVRHEAIDALRELTREVMESRRDEYERARARIGVRREAVFLESADWGDAVVYYWLADDPETSLRAFGVPSDPFESWLRAKESAAYAVPIDTLTTIASKNALIAQYPH